MIHWVGEKLADHSFDDHPADDPERARLAWAVAALDDCEGCDDLRVELTVEEVGRPGTGLVGHLAPASARRLRAALATALRELGEAPDSSAAAALPRRPEVRSGPRRDLRLRAPSEAGCDSGQDRTRYPGASSAQTGNPDYL